MFKYMIGLVLAGLIVFSFEAIADATPDLSMSAEEEAVIRTEDDWIQAEIDDDVGALRRIIHDRFVFNSNDGTTSGKEDLIESVLAWNMTGQKISERAVLIDGDYTSTYVKRGGEWRAIALQMAQRETDE